MKRILAVIISSLMLSGCAGITNDFASTNAAIAQANTDRYRAMTEAVIACGSNAACQVAVSLSFATNAGQQKMIEPERTAEVLGAFVPFASLGLQAFDMFYGGGPTGGQAGAFVITGDNNSLSGIGNNNEASGGSTVTSPYSLSNTFSYDMYNREYTLGNPVGTIIDEGIVDPASDPVTVTDE